MKTKLIKKIYSRRTSTADQLINLVLYSFLEPVLVYIAWSDDDGGDGDDDDGDDNDGDDDDDGGDDDYYYSMDFSCRLQQFPDEHDEVWKNIKKYEELKKKMMMTTAMMMMMMMIVTMMVIVMMTAVSMFDMSLKCSSRIFFFCKCINKVC